MSSSSSLLIIPTLSTHYLSTSFPPHLTVLILLDIQRLHDLKGKKKLQMKTKELSLAIAESSSVIGEVQVEQKQVQQVTPRKRGRPRKVVEKSEEDDDETNQDLQEDMLSKKAKSKDEKSNEELIKEEAKEAPSPTATKDQPRRSRRKSKPRKSC
ncbi:hypothetical protein HanXRQr2_Chr05g0225091 [Helianthus annuus]|uniref:Uncharacterized protein n=1 Tax=Helianthus annuus TaxID=4232 RepID=A0A251UR72_HELAN|nr:uncharacterized protein LOC110941469 isoform X2 [Helianthus annuus]KAF5806736.1 hypothetical protein HanXRQr2_Chr05g0225091 [Helianthus annuus]KAJ0923545.1 hypothetical protein HanPSC8_Chr05g0217221 [Helianthus annuus]